MKRIRPARPAGEASFRFEFQDEAIAALLHDAAEDQGGEATLGDIRERFGDRVRDIVGECSDTFEDPKPPWHQRKERYVAHLEEASPSALRVSLADKLHNVRSILRDHREVGEQVWERFNADRDEILWYYRSLAEVFARRKPGPHGRRTRRDGGRARSTRVTTCGLGQLVRELEPGQALGWLGLRDDPASCGSRAAWARTIGEPHPFARKFGSTVWRRRKSCTCSDAP